MPLEFGDPRHIDDISLDHVLEFPIWVSAHDDRYDEEYEKPIINTRDVSDEVDRLAPIITFKIEGTSLHGSAYYSHLDGQLFALAVWDQDRWVTLDQYEGLALPAAFVAIPTLHGVPNVTFVCNDRAQDKAYRVPPAP